MLAKGYTLDFADRIAKQVEGFGSYGFPESHAASFTLLVYVICWLKRHHPDAFLVALLNSQPMGFYGAGATGAGRARARCGCAAGRRDGERVGDDAGRQGAG